MSDVKKPEGWSDEEWSKVVDMCDEIRAESQRQADAAALRYLVAKHVSLAIGCWAPEPRRWPPPGTVLLRNF